MVVDHGYNGKVDQMQISKFKATCLATLEQVKKTGRPLRITRFGVPVADIVPPQLDTARDVSWLGCMRGTAKIVGDIVKPIVPASEWETAWPRDVATVSARRRTK
jgi:antitoxin (DNA-binding transcriptional repressor) of toxin-antitoxin stability system